MSNYATRQDVKEIVDKAIANDVQKIVDKAVTDLGEVIASFAQQVDDRFDKLESRVDKLEEKFDRLLNTLGGFWPGSIVTRSNSKCATISSSAWSNGRIKSPLRPASR